MKPVEGDVREQGAGPDHEALAKVDRANRALREITKWYPDPTLGLSHRDTIQDALDLVPLTAAQPAPNVAGLLREVVDAARELCNDHPFGDANIPRATRLDAALQAYDTARSTSEDRT